MLAAWPAGRPTEPLVESARDALSEQGEGFKIGASAGYATGYPDRLAGSAIPLGAQIVFVCDAYAAMTSDRCYKLAMSPVEANAELERNAGTQFAPAVVEAFLAAQLAARAAPAVAVA